MKTAILLLTLLCPALAAAEDGVAAALEAARQLWPQAMLASEQPSAPCAGAVEADPPAAARQGKVDVRVRCAGEQPWTRYLRLAVQEIVPVAVLRAPLAHGEALTPAMIEWQPRDRMRLPADLLADNDVPRTARRDLAAGSVLLQSQFTAPKSIQRGQSVTLLSRDSGMEIRATGEALADAALGARVRVRNTASRRVVEGVARDAGIVEVSL